MKRYSINELDFFLITLATISAIIIYISRIGFENDITIILKSASLIYIIILLPRLIYNSISISLKNRFNIQLIILLVIFIILILPYFIDFEDLGLFNFLIAFGPILVTYFFISNMLEFKFSVKKSFFFIFAVIFSIFLTAVYYDSNYTNPLMIEKIINGSWAHREILYHSAIAGMIKTYFFTGTGIDGFVPHYYHIFSHIIFGQFSKILGINTLDFYSIAYPIIITPIFFMLLLHSIKEVSLFFSKVNNFKLTNEKNFFLWFLLFLFFSIPISTSFLTEKYQYIQSQSYAIALSILFLLTGVFFNYVNNTSFNKKLNINKFFDYFTPLVILILCVICSYSKISFLLFFSIIGLFLFFRFSLYKNIYLFFLYFLWLVFFIFIYIKLVTRFDGLDLLLDTNTKINHAGGNEFFYIYISALFIILKIISLEIFSFKSLIKNIYNKKILDLEILSILVVIMYLIPYQYFKGIQLYLAYIFFISQVNLFTKLIFKK